MKKETLESETKLLSKIKNKITMKNKTLLIASLLFVSLIIGCKKKDEKKQDVLPTATEWNKLLDDNLTEMTQKATLDASNTNYIFTSKMGSKVTIDGTSLRKNGNVVTGMVDLEVIEMYQSPEMALTNITTMGINPATNEREQLETGGMLYVMAKQDGTPLTTTSRIKITIPTSNTGGLKSDMQAFDGKIVNGEMTWTVATSFELMTDSGKTNYTLAPAGFGWFNCDRFYSDTRPKTSITTMVPSGYGSNCLVYILTKGYPGSLGSTNGKFPVGLECWLVFVSMKDGQYLWETKQTTLKANHTETFDLSAAQTGSKSDYVGHVTLLR